MSSFPSMQPTTGKSGSYVPLLIQFGYLQLLDLLTTLAFLATGIQEANPLVRFLISGVGSPLAALAVLKTAALVMGLFCWQSGRRRLLARVNLFFAALVVWNLAALLAARA